MNKKREISSVHYYHSDRYFDALIQNHHSGTIILVVHNEKSNKQNFSHHPFCSFLLVNSSSPAAVEYVNGELAFKYAYKPDGENKKLELVTIGDGFARHGWLLYRNAAGMMVVANLGSVK